MQRRPSRHVFVLAVALLAAVGVVSSGWGPAGAAVVAQALDCGIGGSQTMNIVGTAPSTVAPGGTFTVDLAPQSAKANGGSVANLVWSFQAPTGSSIVAGSATTV